ncbi:amidohydrolase family protein [Streptomyces sp. NPDC048277]|uniref:amidohydrolase family protein n=1 Tax=Streptomyces sp. NPDC048277 TaxID=3155027 RepID=UPI00340E56DD
MRARSTSPDQSWPPASSTPTPTCSTSRCPWPRSSTSARHARGRTSSTPSGSAHFYEKESWRDLPEGALPDAAALDAATTEHPVMIQAWAPHVPNHAAFNSAALGIDADLPDGEGGITVEKDAGGRPTGRVSGAVNDYYNHTHNDFRAEVWGRIPFIQPQLLPPALSGAMAEQNGLGVTTIYEGHAMDPEHIGVYEALYQAGALTLRVLAAPEVLGSALDIKVAAPDEDKLAEHLAKAEAIQGDRGEMFKVNGPGYNGHLAMREPYKGPYGETTEGHWFIPSDIIELALREAARRGLRVNLCGGGLKEHDVVLDLLGKLRTDGVIKGGEHWIFQHSIFLDARQAERYAGHGFDMTVSTAFTYGKGEMYRERMGEQVLADLNAFRRMLDSGIKVAAGTDWGPKNPWESMALAVTHTMGKGVRAPTTAGRSGSASGRPTPCGAGGRPRCSAGPASATSTRSVTRT